MLLFIKEELRYLIISDINKMFQSNILMDSQHYLFLHQGIPVTDKGREGDRKEGEVCG